MPHVLIAGYGELHPDGISLLETRANLTHETIAQPDIALFRAKLPHADALLIRTAPVPAETLELAGRLRVVSRHGIGYDNIPVAALTKRGIPLTIIDSVNSVSVAEHTLFLMLAVAKSCLLYDQSVRKGDWTINNSLLAAELCSKTLLLVGFGRVGIEVAKRALAFGMRVFACDPGVEEAQMHARGVSKIDDWKALLGDVDFLSLHLPKTPETEGLLGPQELRTMKPSAILVNTARGGLIEEKALCEALKSRQIAGAGLDTFSVEPLSQEHPLVQLDNVVLSPHSAALTRECMARMSVSAAKNILAGLDGNLDPRLVINPEVLQA